MYLFTCPAGYQLIFFQKGRNPCCSAQCSTSSTYDGTSPIPVDAIPLVTPFSNGLNDLAWSDVTLLIAAMFAAAASAAAYHILSRLFYRG